MRERGGRGEEESVYALGSSCAAPLSNGAPRVARHRAPAASQKPKMHVDSSQVESCLNPVRGVRDAQRRAGIKPTDHARQNLLAVKERSRLNALRRLSQTEADERNLPDAGSPVGARQLRTAPAAACRAGGTARGHSMGLPVTPGTRTTQQRGGSSGAGSGSGSGGGLGLGRDFIEENKAAAAAAAARRSGRGGTSASLRQAPGGGTAAVGGAAAAAAEDFTRKRDYGRVPAYLVERRLQMAEEERAREAAREAALVPPGMRVMPEEERLETLELLARNRTEVEGALSALSLTSDTIGARRRRDELERRLAEVAEAVKVFSRPRVLVRL